MMPPHDTYIETHLGGGAIMRRKPAALHNIAIDLDLNALRAFKCEYPIEKVHSCAHEFLSTYIFCGRELVYCDPPYLRYTRTSSRRYRFDYEERDHIELLELLKRLACSVILSGYPSGLYDELLTDWGSLELQVMNQAGVRTEKIWFTLPLTGCTGPATQAKISQIGNASNVNQKAGQSVIKRFLARNVWPCFPP